jgi:hypothetical protein
MEILEILKKNRCLQCYLTTYGEIESTDRHSKVRGRYRATRNARDCSLPADTGADLQLKLCETSHNDEESTLLAVLNVELVYGLST